MIVFGFCQDFLLVKRQDLSFFHQDASADDGICHVGSIDAFQQGIGKVP